MGHRGTVDKMTGSFAGYVSILGPPLSGSWAFTSGSAAASIVPPPSWSGVITITSASLAPYVHVGGNPTLIQGPKHVPDDIEFGLPGNTRLKLHSHEDGSIRLTLTHNLGHSFEIKIDDSPETKRALIAVTKMFKPV